MFLLNYYDVILTDLFYMVFQKFPRFLLSMYVFCVFVCPLELLGKKIALNDRSHAMDISRITKVILKNCQIIRKMTHLTVKNTQKRRIDPFNRKKNE